MDQLSASTDLCRDGFAVTVDAPRDWDGIGQALRAAYRDYRDAPCDIAAMLHQLDTVD